MTLEARLRTIARRDPVLWRMLTCARALALPDWRIVSGAIYNSVWNALTLRPAGYGIKDVDLFYFDRDTSWEAEDREIRRTAATCPATPPFEVRNQARVHLWFERHFGYPIAPFRSTDHAIANFAAITHAVGLRLEPDGQLDVCAPFGLEAIFGLRMVPNPAHPNKATYEAKALRCKSLWPEITIEPWPDRPKIAEAGSTTDWTEVLGLLQRAFEGMDGRIDPPSSLHRMDAADLRTKSTEETCLLAHAGDRLSGCIFCKQGDDHLYISKLAVDPAQQSRGIGRALIEAVAGRARAHGLGALELQTRIELTENHAAFARCGFEKIATTSHPGFDRPTSVTMRRAL